MADSDKRVDLISRVAQKMERKDRRSLAERAAERLSQMDPSRSAETMRPKADVQPAMPAPSPNRAQPAASPPADPAPAADPASPTTAMPVQGEGILSARGRRDESPPAAGNGVAAAETAGDPAQSRHATPEDVISSVQSAGAADLSSHGVLSASGRRAATMDDESAPAEQAARRPAVKKAREEAELHGQRATIDLMRLHLAGFVTPSSERTRISEEYRVIKRPLLLNAFSRGQHHIPNGHLIMVTSARPGEGKTFTSLNLAMSMASERELFVLLIDADVHRATLMSELGIEAEKGLVDLLVDDSISLQDVLVRTNVPNLTLLPSGMRHSEATELLASQRMTQVMDDIASRYPDRVIIIDTPPVLASSEAGVLGLQVGQVVMVVEWGATNRQAIEQALPLIGTCPNVNFVLNKATFYIGSDRFGSYTSDGVYGYSSY